MISLVEASCTTASALCQGFKNFLTEVARFYTGRSMCKREHHYDDIECHSRMYIYVPVGFDIELVFCTASACKRSQFSNQYICALECCLDYSWSRAGAGFGARAFGLEAQVLTTNAIIGLFYSI